MNAKRPKIRKIGAVFAGLVVFALSHNASAGTQPSRAYLIKAAFLYDLVKSTFWPRDSSILDFCVYGENPFNGALDLIDGQPVQDRTLKVRSLLSADGVADCEVVFVGNSAEIEVVRLLAEANRHSVLTVSEITDFIDSGGMVRLKEVDNRLRFDVNALAIRQSGLVVSVNALELADTGAVGAIDQAP